MRLRLRVRAVACAVGIGLCVWLVRACGSLWARYAAEALLELGNIAYKGGNSQLAVDTYKYGQGRHSFCADVDPTCRTPLLPWSLAAQPWRPTFLSPPRYLPILQTGAKLSRSQGDHAAGHSHECAWRAVR